MPRHGIRFAPAAMKEAKRMATSRTRKTHTASPRARETAKRQPKQNDRERAPQERGSAAQDEKLIGAERFPRKGDEDEEAE